MVRGLREKGVHACYLGLWREPEKAFFGRTSVSSKMTSYAAAGLPIIADVSEDAEVWRMITKHGAGVRLSGESHDIQTLESLFRGGAGWESHARGALQLCEQELNLERNIEEFKHLLEVTRG